MPDNYAQRYYAPGQPQQMFWNPVTKWWQPVPLRAPKILTTFWITFFFGIFGVIPAIIHSNQAHQMEKPVGVYWLTFFGTLLAIIVLLAAVFG